MRRYVLIGLTVLLGACTEARFADDGVGDASTGDSGSGIDGGGDGVDAGPRDLGPPRDLGEPRDLGPRDMGPLAMPPDLGPCDPCRPGPGDLVITEIMPDSDVVSDDFGEWFEVYNPSDTVTYDLIGCVLADSGNSHPVAEEALVAPGAYFTLARFDTAAGGFLPDYYYAMTLKFANEGDLVRITCGAQTVDVVDFTTWTINKGLSLALDPSALDATANDDVANWCTGLSPYHMGAGETDYGSPGEANPACP